MTFRDELRRAETYLRRDDKALRLRLSELYSDTVLIERKTFRGRIGRLLMGQPYDKDGGRRREEGHVLIAHFPCYAFNVRELRASLQVADTWRYKNRLWERVEAAENPYSSSKLYSKQSNSRYKASEFFDRYSWKYKSRIAVPEAIA